MGNVFRRLKKLMLGKFIILVNKSLFFKNIKGKANIRISSLDSLDFSKESTVTIENYLNLEKGCLLATRNDAVLSIGDGVYINRNTLIIAHKEINISSGVTIGPNCCIYDHDHDYSKRGSFLSASIDIGKNVWIGANVVILKGISIGDDAVISAGCIITKDVPANTIVIQKRNIEYRRYR